MMGERMTSNVEAFHMKRAIDRVVDELEREGFDRGQIGAVIVGIGGGLVAVHSGKKEAAAVFGAVQKTLEAEHG